MLLFFDISGGEILVILAVVFLVFGPRRVPEIARQIGKGMNEMRKITSDLTKEFHEGAGQVKKEIGKVTDSVQAEGRKLTNDLISGPAEIFEDGEPPSDTTISSESQTIGTSPEESEANSESKETS